MITLTILFLIIYAWSIYKIRIDSGSWDNFNPFNTNPLVGMVFILGLSVITLVLILVVYLSINNIIA